MWGMTAVIQSERGRCDNTDPALTTPLLGIATMAADKIRAPWGVTKLPEYGSYSAMRSRCLNPGHHAYARYGGRGITICERWDSFAAFMDDMGPRPSPQHTIERRDNDGNYEPSNCYWATKAEQNGNRSFCRLITAFGQRLSIAAWARKTGFPLDVLYQRLAGGLTLEQALKLPFNGKKGSGSPYAFRLAQLEGGKALQTARENHPKRRPVIAPDGRVWASISLAAEAYGLNPGAIWWRCQRGLYGWRFA